MGAGWNTERRLDTVWLSLQLELPGHSEVQAGQEVRLERWVQLAKTLGFCDEEPVRV